MRSTAASLVRCNATTGHVLCVLLAAAVAAVLVPPTLAEKRTLDILVPPTDQFIHYTDGIIRGPGTIDLKHLTFTAVSESYTADEYDGKRSVDDDENNMHDDDNINIVIGDDFVERRRQHHRHRHLDGGIDVGGTTLDIAIFHMSHKCAKNLNGCDWTDYGIGGRLDDGTLRWCCSDESIQRGLCNEQDSGRLIVNQHKFHGELRFISVPSEGPMSRQMRYGAISATETGMYVVIFSNCNVRGREISITGESEWVSEHGYLPGELYGFMNFYEVVLVVYFVLFCWYVAGMHFHKDSRIPIEKWILMTIILGLFEMFSRTADYAIWNTNGYRGSVLAYVSVIAGVMKKGISRCLIVMVSLGWGVIRDSLGSIMRYIVVFGAVYSAVAVTSELMIVFAVNDMQTMSYEKEAKIFDAVTVLTIVLVIIDVVFVLWILDALSQTMSYLENMNQTRKMMRYLQLRHIFVFAILFAAIRLIFAAVDTYDDEGIVEEEHEWVIEAAEELNYLFVLIGVAILWRPNPTAKEYAYVLELPAIDEDDESNDGNHIEFAAGSVPCAMDEDDDDDDDDNVQEEEEEGKGTGAARGGGYRDNKDSD